MNGSRGHYAKSEISQRNTNTVMILLFSKMGRIAACCVLMGIIQWKVKHS